MEFNLLFYQVFVFFKESSAGNIAIIDDFANLLIDLSMGRLREILFETTFIGAVIKCT